MKMQVRVVLGGAFVLVGALGIGALSRVPYTTEPTSHAHVRLAWRTRGERVEECRQRTPEELMKLPVHMREDEVCAGRILPYRLRVFLDEVPAGDVLVRAAGAREDRPLYVYQDLAVAPGRRRVRVEFVRQGQPKGGTYRERREAVEVEARLSLDTTFALGEREVALVTYDAEAGRLVLRLKETS